MTAVFKTNNKVEFFKYSEITTAIKSLGIKRNDIIHTAWQKAPSVQFYQWYLGKNEEKDDKKSDIYYFVLKGYKNIQDMTKEPVQILLKLDNVEIYKKVNGK